MEKTPKCGNCKHWMDHHECHHEQWKDGRWYGPSMSSWPCERYLNKYPEDEKKAGAEDE